MSDTRQSTTDAATDADPTAWDRVETPDPIAVRDPLAELLGMVPEGDPLVVTFPEVAKAAGHACPAVAGAYRASDLALDRLYPDSLPVRSEVAVTVGGDPAEPGLGPMASVVRHVTGAADERGFAGFGGYGGREELLAFGDVPGPGRSFRFERADTGDAVRVSFDPAGAGMDPSGGPPGDSDDSSTGDRPSGDDDGPGESGGPPAGPMATIPALVSGDADERQRERFREQWHTRVEAVLRADPSPGSPFALTEE